MAAPPKGKAIRAQEHTRHVPVIIFSSSDRPADISESYGMGANGYVLKPLEFQEYAQALQELVHYWTSINVAM